LWALCVPFPHFKSIGSRFHGRSSRPGLVFVEETGKT
jgi:hypothetical protein